MIYINKYRLMLLRILILVFAFNAIIPSAFAMGEVSGCKMEMNNSSLVSNIACSMPDMEENCRSVQCLNSCVINITPLVMNNEQAILTSVSIKPPLSKLAYFYQIILPVSTPPPLV